MLKSFAKDSISYTIPSFFSKGISILLIPLYTRVLSPADYGIFDLFIVFMNIVNLTVAFEITQGLARFYILEENEDHKVGYSSTAFWFSLFCYLSFFIVSYFFSKPLSHFVLGNSNSVFIFQIGVLYILVNGLLQLVQNQYRWQMMSFNFMVNSLMQIILTSMFSLLFIYYLNLKILGLFLGLLLGAIFPLFLGIYQLKKSFQFRFDTSKLYILLKHTIPLVPASISVWVISYIDRVMIQHFYGNNEVGIYGIGFRISSAIMILIVGFQTALTPLIFKHHADSNTPKKVAFLFKSFLLLVFVSCLVFVVFLSNILELLTSPEFFDSRYVIIFMLPSVIFSQLYIFFPGIGLTGKTYLILLINFGGGILNILLNLLFIPYYSYIGASIATMISQLVVFLSFLLVSQKLYFVPHNWSKILPFTIFFFSIYFVLAIFRVSIFDSLIIRVFILILSIQPFFWFDYFNFQERAKLIDLFRVLINRVTSKVN